MSATRLATLGAVFSFGLSAAALAEDPARPAPETPAIASNLGIALPEPPETVVIRAEPDQTQTGAIASVSAEAEHASRIALPLPEPPPAVVIAEDGPAKTRRARGNRGARRRAAAPAAGAGPGGDTAPSGARRPGRTAPSQRGSPARATVKTAIEQLRASRRLSEAELAGALAFYEARGFAPLWIEGGDWNLMARSVRARMAAAADDGLDASRYRSVAAFHAAGEPHFPALAAAEAQLTEAALLYAREASTGRVRPSQIHELITPALKPPAAADVLASLSTAADAGEALRAFNPPHPEFAALREALAAARAARPIAKPPNTIPEGPPLRLGMSDPRVPLIRMELGLDPLGPPVYDRTLAVRVASLQRESGLPATGQFTPATRRAMLGEGPSAEEAEIIANMELWRFVPRDLGREHIFVNAPALEVVVRREGEVVHRARTIIARRRPRRRSSPTRWTISWSIRRGISLPAS